MKMSAMLDGAKNQKEQRSYDQMSFEERFGELVDRENRRLKSRVRQAKMRQQAYVADVDFRARRNLKKSDFLSLAKCSWIKEKRNLLITGPTGVGKSYLSCALGHQACLDGYKTLYIRLPRFLTELTIARGDGSYIKLLKSLLKVDLLVIDDWGLSNFTDDQRRDFLEVMEDRYEMKSTLITSQLPVKSWYDVIGESTVADAILDRLVHNSYRIELKGESLRKKAKATEKEAE